VVITPAPRQAMASWDTIEGRLFTQGSTNEPKLRMVVAADLPQPELRYLALVFVTCRNLPRQPGLPWLVACGLHQAQASAAGGFPTPREGMGVRSLRRCLGWRPPGWPPA
jgi:hypothetical protein